MSDQKANVPSYIERLKKPVGVPPFIQREVADILQWHVDEIERLTAELQAARERLLEDTADNERLRVALQEIALDTCNPTNEPHVYAVRAREALAAVEDKG